MKVHSAAALLAIAVLAPAALRWSAPGFDLPHAAVMQEAWAAGRFPFWDIYNDCGRPFAANPATQAFYPPRWITAAFSKTTADVAGALRMEVLAHLAMAGLFVALLMRRLAFRWLTAALGGIALAAAACFAAPLERAGAVESLAWLPGVLWGISRLLDRSGLGNVVWLAVLLSAASLSGFVPGIAAVYMSGVLFGGMLAWERRTPALSLMLRFAGAAMLSLMLLGMVVVPCLELIFHSGSRDARHAGDRAELSLPAAPAWRYDSIAADSSLSSRAPLLRARSASGFDPLPLQRAVQSRQLVNNPNASMLEAMNVDVLLSGEPLPESAPAWDLSQSAPIHVYNRRTPSQRFYFAQSITQVNGIEEAVRVALTGKWSPRNFAIVEQGRLKTTEQISSGGKVTQVSEAPGEIRLRTANSGAGFLVVSEAYYPGWRAQIDGRPARLFPANVAFQGLWIPAGGHAVVLSYNPTIFAMGAALSIATTISLAIALVLIRLRARSSRSVSG